jgi:serine phosphatase RsbU (regulator of sigma subunit)/tetratricopeptide (TPR) repeat protein
MKKILLLSILFSLFSSFAVFSQNTGQDKALLLQKIEKSSDIEQKIAYYLQLAAIERNENNIAKSLNYAEEALKIAVQHNVSGAKEEVFLEKSRTYLQKGSSNTALNYAIQALVLHERAENKSQIALVETEIGKIYLQDQIYDKAIQHLQRAADFYVQENKTQTLANQTTVELLADANLGAKKYEISLQGYENLVAIQEITKATTSNKSRVLQKMTVAANHANQVEKAIATAEKHLNLLQSSGNGANNKEEIAYTANSLGYLYRQKKDNANSTKYFTLALENLNAIAKKDKNVLNNIGVTYTNLQKYEEARKYYNQAIASTEKEPAGQAQSYNYLAVNSLLNANYRQALQEVDRAIQISTNANAIEQLAESYLVQSEIYNTMQDAVKSQQAYKLHLAEKQVLDNKQDAEQATLQQKRIQAEQTENEIRLLIASQEKQALELQQLRLENEKKVIETTNAEKTVSLLKKEAELKESKLRNEALEKTRAEQALQIAQKELEDEKRKRQLEELNQKQQLQEFALKQQDLEKKEQQKAIDLLQSQKSLLQKEKELKELADEEAKFRNRIFYVIASIILAALLYVLFLFSRMKKQQKIIEAQSLRLEAQNHELFAAEEETRQNAEELAAINENLVVSQKEIASQNLHITSSINYAKRIQQAMLPQREIFNDYFAENFIFYMPRDIVSGDFYWANYENNLMFVVVADCTGHGVPGAFMSLIGSSLLNQIIIEKEIKEPAQILTSLNMGVCKALQQSSNMGTIQVRDGMDLALCVIEKLITTDYLLKFAGAKNGMMTVSEGKMEIIEADRKAIGEKISNEFTQKEINIPKNSYLYLFSDGFHDQIGKETNRRFMSKNLRNLLAENAEQPSEKQQEILETTFSAWKGNTRQLDDVLVVGLKLK